MEGLFLRHLFAGRLQTRNPLLLVLLTVCGVACLLPLVAAITQSPDSEPLAVVLICFVPLATFGFALLVNVALSLRARARAFSSGGDKRSHRHSRHGH